MPGLDDRAWRVTELKKNSEKVDKKAEKKKQDETIEPDGSLSYMIRSLKSLLATIENRPSLVQVLCIPKP